MTPIALIRGAGRTWREGGKAVKQQTNSKHFRVKICDSKAPFRTTAATF